MIQDKVVVDLNELFPGKPSLSVVQDKLASWDFTPYRDKTVALRGCLPTWAHLMVAGKLFGTASSVEFIVDDGKGGQPITVYQRS